MSIKLDFAEVDFSVRGQMTARILSREFSRIDSGLERQRENYKRRMNNQRRLLEARRKQFKSADIVKVPEMFRMTEREIALEVQETQRSRKPSTAPPSRKTSQFIPPPKLDLPQVPVMSEECSDIYKDLQCFFRGWKNPPRSLMGGNNRAYLQRTLRSLARDLSPDKFSSSEFQSARSSYRLSARSAREVDVARPPTTGPGSRMYEKQRWLEKQLEGYEAQRAEARRAKDEEERKKKQSVAEDQRKRSIWTMLHKYSGLNNSEQQPLQSNDAPLSNGLPNHIYQDDELDNNRKISAVKIVEPIPTDSCDDNKQRQLSTRHLSVQKVELMSVLHVGIPSLREQKAEHDHQANEQRKKLLMKRWQDHAWKEAAKARYVRCREKRPIEQEVEVFPKRA